METQSLLLKLQHLEDLLIGQKDVLTFDEALAYTGISRSYMYKLTSTGKIPHYKPFVKQLYFNRAELTAWLLQNPVITENQMEEQALSYLFPNSNQTQITKSVTNKHRESCTIR